MSPRRLISVPLALGMLLFALSLFGARSAAAQGGAPDFANFGYPTVLAAGNFVPGTAMTITGGGQEVILPADFISKTVKFELLGGDTNAWTGMLPADAAGRQVTAAFAFRVTDANGTIVGRFDKPVIWSITSAAVAPNADIYNTTAANPPVVTKNGTPPTLDGQKLSHSFGGAGVGWLAVNQAGAAVPVGMPTTGAPFGLDQTLMLAAFAGLLLLAGGLLLRRARASR